MKVGIRVFRFRDLPTGMNDGRVILAPEMSTDFRIRGVGQLTAEIHCDLSRMHERLARRRDFSSAILTWNLAQTAS